MNAVTTKGPGEEVGVRNVVKGCALVLIAGSMMGNQSCEQQKPPEARELRRRVQMGQVMAPAIALPQGGTFNFQYVANVQMYDVLSKTKSFSTAKVDPSKTYDPSGLSNEDKALFNQCGDEESQESVHVNGKLMSKSIIYRESACMINLPQAVISGNILDFTLISSSGARLSLAGIPFAPSVSFNIKRYELSLAMRAMHPLIPGGHAVGDRYVIATTSKESFGREWGASLGLTFSMLGLGLDHYQKTPMRQIVEEGLTDAIQDLKSQWNQAEPWYGMVLRNCDKYIYINAGNSSDAGLQVGDIVRVQNVDYEWSGKACESTLLGAVDYAGGPVAYARVRSVGNTISTAEIIERDPQYPYSPDQVIRPGARVYMEKLFVQPAAAAKK